MGNWDIALTALIGMSAFGFLLADGECRRVGWVRAMRRCLFRLADMIRYERHGICALLYAINLRLTPQERMLTRLLHTCAAAMEREEEKLSFLFARESAKLHEYGVLSKEDREPFEKLIAELGEMSLDEQLRLISDADEALRRREEELNKEGAQRRRLFRTLGVCSGAGLFLLLI